MGLELTDFDTGLQVLVKQPSEVRKYKMDFAGVLVDASLASVISATATAQAKVTGASAVVVANAAVSGDFVTMTLSAGTHDENYLITVRVLDSVGNTLEGDGMLYVRDV